MRSCLPKLIAFAWILLAMEADLARAANADSLPNVVFILADDLGWADIGYHNSDTLTPSIDHLAAGGTRLEQHYVWPTCSPTRVALLTGREPSRFGVLEALLTGNGHLPPDIVTLPGALRSRGYTTHISGKWHIGTPPDYRPLLFDFDTSYGSFRGQIDPYTHRYKLGHRTWHRNDQLFDEEGHATDLIADEAIRVIRASREKPFFLYVSFTVPHYPLAEPDRWTAMYDGKTMFYGTGMVDGKTGDRWRKLNAASISHMDEAVGRIVEALQQAGKRENTLIVFTSDNGGQQAWEAPKVQYEGRYQPHTTLGNNRPLRGWKTELYEGGIRVPCCVNWPGHVPAGQAVRSPVSIMDWMPTFCELTDASAESSWQLSGQDILPLIFGKEKISEKARISREKGAQPRTFYWATSSELAVRHGDWKLIRNRTGNGSSIESPADSRSEPQLASVGQCRVELFNLADDPYEKTDLSGQQPDRVAELTRILEEQRKGDR